MKIHYYIVPALFLWYASGFLAYIDPIPGIAKIIFELDALTKIGSAFLVGFAGIRIYQNGLIQNHFNRFFVYLMPFVWAFTGLQIAVSVLINAIGYDWEPQTGFSLLDAVFIGLSVAVSFVRAVHGKEYHRHKMGFRVK